MIYEIRSTHPVPIDGDDNAELVVQVTTGGVIFDLVTDGQIVATEAATFEEIASRLEAAELATRLKATKPTSVSQPKSSDPA